MSNEMLTPEELKNKLLPYVEKWAPNCEFLLDEATEEKSPGSYNARKKLIIMRYLPLTQDHERLKNTEVHISLFEQALLILAHEVGHHLDKKIIRVTLKGRQQLIEASYIKAKLKKEESDRERYLQCIESYYKIKFLKEVRAWQNARRLIKDEISKDYFYQQLRECLSSYLETFKRVYERAKNDFNNSKPSGAS